MDKAMLADIRTISIIQLDWQTMFYFKRQAMRNAHLMQQEIKCIAEGQAKGSKNLPCLFLDLLIDAQANCSVFGRR